MPFSPTLSLTRLTDKDVLVSRTLIFAFAATLTTAASAADSNLFDHALERPEGAIFRAQDSGTSESTTISPLTVPPPGTSTFYPPQTFSDPTLNGGLGTSQFGTQVNPGLPAPITQDPFVGGVAPPAALPQGYGVFGPQPQRFGWSPRFDVEWIPSSDTSSPDVGDVEIFGVDANWEYRTPTGTGAVWAVTPQFNYRSVQGPDQGDASRDLPGSLFRFGLDMALQSTAPGGCTFEFGFTPAIATDLNESLESDSFQFDGRAVAYIPVSPQWQWVVGMTYWDRVDDILLPYGGAIWTPNDLWEFRILFPKSRASVFLGTPNGVPMWLYVDAEYHVESYQVGLPGGLDDAKVQFEDWRVLGGFRWEAGWVTSFIEGGYVFDRNVEYTSPGTGYDIDGQFIGRLGFRF